MIGYYYLASPYSKFDMGLGAAHIVACQIAARLIRAGYSVYSPIAHTHPIAVHGEIDPRDHKIWLPVDAPLMNAAIGVFVAQIPGWRESLGVQHELAWFREQKRPVMFVRWPEFKIGEEPFDV